MKVRIGDGATGDEAEAIASALARHLGTDVNVFVGDGEESVADAEPPADAFPLDADDVHPTEREETLREEIADILGGGPQKYKDRLPESGKLFVRDRLDLWFPEGLKFEDGKFANFDSWHENSPEVDEADPNTRLPGDGLLTGAAAFEGRDLHFMANDFTVKAGSMASRGVEKFLRMQQRALKTGKPVLYLMDSSGGRIDQQTGFFANREGIGKYYYNHSMLSGYVPQICVLYGPCIAGAAYTPVFADFTIMVEGMSAMAIASPRMVKMVTGEEISMQDLGGAQMHAQESGSADLVARDEQHARELVSQLITYLPDKAGEKPPRSKPKPPRLSPGGIDELIPESPNRPYDAHDLIERVVDAESVFELKPDYGKEIVTAFARIDGRPVGIVANQPTERSGAIFPDAAEKAAEFIWTCDAYEIPLLYLCDTPGFMAGSQVEKDAILEKGKKFIYATSSATVPKQTVIVRKAYGAGIYAMGGPAYDPDSVIALPSGEIGIMGPEAAINAVYANKLAAIDDPEERKQREDELREEYREDIDAHRMASEVVIDEIVPPSSLREELVNRFEFYADVDKSLPDKKHGTVL
ncbi:acyl-CoA carboxylase subunit beta [Haloferax mediterranei ATCC 33500]|uniref:Acyl-CoA carboxylase subunit beta n=1 Tax=Haloferax mediterranei (strain ATCC 33500 / DSM 1411 / JCM 8866 / NBRC 14739 / NCIMB 2177 / R-4) TaxID=523841 RepID=I3R4R0_HALMT|nr:acyl-CoA carboxylase subunit beta [Haloferax mediterranei]AFK19220.2 propionyl-CoA carboxylase carboxyltransferase component [Haloferax mediterranei ATCC 33500]AHZ21418.1 propionyl-CoA carboxylase [Haloferax mediterranei ATCC 33500]EMA03877.1 propionyl-CoA carboxylase carboxyltransferase component [Haloferax mediterranei ATCC 33500]MDX5989321.1 acyl-CoA carboxylase subunit beta [Haloferax mediterranei ATCC 33500]QCQ75687.1 acyl-CoA carboxylase subunit beta [Haloferax mediterranei ATCC 33500